MADKASKPFVIQKRSNHGARNPIVASLCVQTGEVIKLADLAKTESDEVGKLYYTILPRSLLRCHDALTRLKEARTATVNEVAAIIDQGARSAPFVVGLEDELNTFLYEAKLYLRDCLRVLNAFFGTDFKDASRLLPYKGKDGAVIKWAMAKFGADAHFTRMLRSEAPWVSDLIKFRNAVEHLDAAGEIVIENYRAVPQGFIEPTWRREGIEPRQESAIYPDLDIFLDNLLTFGEDLLINCVRARRLSPYVEFALIPEEDRDPECPVRVQAVLVGVPNLPRSHI